MQFMKNISICHSLNRKGQTGISRELDYICILKQTLDLTYWASFVAFACQMSEAYWPSIIHLQSQTIPNNSAMAYEFLTYLFWLPRGRFVLIHLQTKTLSSATLNLVIKCLPQTKFLCKTGEKWEIPFSSSPWQGWCQEHSANTSPELKQSLSRRQDLLCSIFKTQREGEEDRA